jgi:TRAP-type C4-dicarboxylate transport system permease small subunit
MGRTVGLIDRLQAESGLPAKYKGSPDSRKGDLTMQRTTLAIERTFLWNAVLKVLRTLIFICAVVTLVVMIASVIMRYFLHMDFFGYEDIEILFILWMYYLGGAYATWEESHIKGDVVSFFFKSAKAKKFYKVSIQVFAVVCMSFWMKWGLEYVMWNFNAAGKTSALKIPLVASQAAIYVGICGLFIYSLFHLIKYIKMKPEEFLTEGDQ